MQLYRNQLMMPMLMISLKCILEPIMKIILISMPDVASIVMHESAIHMPNCGIASVGGNIDDGHEVFIIDLIRKRRRLKKYLTNIQ